MFLDEALKKRHSVRVFANKPVRLDMLAHLLWASTGIRRIEKGQESRTAPSAGALYPIETYTVVNSIEELDKGVYHYSIKEQVLECIRKVDRSRQIAAAAMGQDMCAKAAAVIIWTAIFQRCKVKYGQRAYRYIYLDAGHIAQNLALTAVSSGLGSCPVAAFYDEEVNSIIDVDGAEESALYMTALGNPVV
jgi:SagB-type dehydrogenase family enzyme